ncbi:hypothetical protein ABOM_003302 [Aspergillus bombycis]|uniref:Uncharacterized protein n=1 Tax=Aspergillus bombycis TaxID=109264 RepID=A0A1F8A8P3_9EURO|nr:hypothetical protein ABOM_003302 [Aspergillus bombycis]OGM47799.1 hypothetical protein ABOM_003302 [Aspergillus bombycis]
MEYNHEWLWTESSCAKHISSNDLLKCIYDIYGKASLCFVYLSDIGPDQDWKKSVWFTQTHTLPELVASKKIVFFRRNWTKVGSKDDLCEELSRLTFIDKTVLKDPGKVQSCSVAKRMSWASERHPPVNGHREPVTEECAYCLIGIFRVSKSFVPRYGVGLAEAMLQLQHEIMREYPKDLSIFEWKHTDPSEPLTNDVLAGSPFQFRDCANVTTLDDGSEIKGVTDRQDEFYIDAQFIPESGLRIGWALNCWHDHPYSPTGNTLIYLTKEPPESHKSTKTPNLPGVKCHRTNISNVSCIDREDLRKTLKVKGRIHILKDGACHFEQDETSARLYGLVQNALSLRG